MKRELLKELGLSDEQIDKIMAENGKDIEAQKTKTTSSETAAQQLADQLAEANKQIEGFRAMPKVEDVQKAADEYKAKYEKATKDSANQVSALKFEHALDAALTTAKAKNAKAVKALLDPELLKLTDDGSISGLNEQLEKIKTDNDFLFESETPTPRIVAGGNHQSVLANPLLEAAFKGAGLKTPEISKEK